MSTPYDYKVQIDFARDPATILCTCSDCDWKGTADLLEDIDECSLTPGDPSPAGRCPECDSLAYVDQPDKYEVLAVLHRAKSMVSLTGHAISESGRVERAAVLTSLTTLIHQLENP